MLSHHHKTIFVHVPKTGGQSVERVFLEDIGLTWKTRAPLLLRHNPEPSLGPERLAHLTAEQYVSCKYVPQEMFDRYFKFAFVRDPWDRVVSMYRYLPIGGSFKSFVCKVLPKSLWATQHWFVRPQADFLLDQNGAQLVDFVGRFASLEKDFFEVCRKVGLPERLPHVNAAAESRRQLPHRLAEAGKALRRGDLSHLRAAVEPTRPSKPGRDYYDREAAEAIGELYKIDVQTFGFRF